jgi:putative transposase
VYGVLASLAPLLVIVWMLRTGRIADLHVSNTKDRRIPYLVGTVGAVLAFLVVRSWGTLPLLTSFILVNIISMIVLNILNQYWLVSAHVSGITALMLFFGFAYGFWAGLAFFPFVLLTIYVRLYLKRHTTNEIFGGLALGTASVLPVILLGVRTF